MKELWTEKYRPFRRGLCVRDEAQKKQVESWVSMRPSHLFVEHPCPKNPLAKKSYK